MDNNNQNKVENKPNQFLTAEQKLREKERLEREKKEEEELKKRLDEKQKKKKEKEKRLELKKKQEQKRIKKLINLPFKLHIQVSLLVTTLSFIILFFGLELEPLRSIYYTFLIFVSFYLGTGLVMVGVFFLISEEKIAEMEEIKKMEETNKVQEKTKREIEMEEMAQIDKEIEARKLLNRQFLEGNSDITDNSIDSNNLNEDDFINDSIKNQTPMFDLDDDANNSLDNEFVSSNDIGGNNSNDNYDNNQKYDLFDDEEFLDLDLQREKK